MSAIPIEAIDAAAQVLGKTFSGQFSRGYCEELARRMLEAVALKCVPDWQVCDLCGDQRRAMVWRG